MTQSPCLPELPKLPRLGCDMDGRESSGYDGRDMRDYATTHGLACYEAGSAAAAQAVPGWIGVEDRLPDERASAYLVAVIAKKTYSEGSNYPGMGIRSVVQDWVVRNYASSYTHWMALPEITPAAPTQGAEGAAPQTVVREASERIALLETALSEVLEFQSAPEGPHIFDWGRWRRIRENTPPFQRATPTAPQEADALRETLTELVALKDMKDRFAATDYSAADPGIFDAARADYARRKPLAWAAARAALAQHQPQQGEQHE